MTLESGVRIIQENPEATRNVSKFSVAVTMAVKVSQGNNKGYDKYAPRSSFGTWRFIRSKGPDRFFEMFNSLDEKDKLKITLGYHDTDNDGDDSSLRFSEYLSHFDMSEPFYSFDYKNIHMLAMATGSDALIPYDEGSAQYEFVKSDHRSSSARITMG